MARLSRKMNSRRISGIRGAATIATLALGVGVAVTADAQGIVLHEYIPPDPQEDVAFAATTLDGQIPAAIQTPSGVATAPDPQQAPDPDRVYSGNTVDDGPDSTYRPDRDTSRPNIENYDDPFSPATVPFKRLRAYDAVDADYTLRVADKARNSVQIGGRVQPNDEQFYADLSVDLLAQQPVRLPTVGPGQRILKMHVNPEVGVSLLADGAENLFIQGDKKERVRIVMEIAIARATFGSEFLEEVDWDDLSVHMRPQPEAHREAFEQVADEIGVHRGMSPAQALARMVEYFRDFKSSDDRPEGRGDVYLDLALSKKGVCRHRSFAFLVTALNLGIPTRMVVNEAHAWVEVYDTQLWHRIDLGGAALNLSHDADPTSPPHQPPPDPFEWPEGGEEGSGQGLGERARDESDASGDSDSESDPSRPGEPGQPGDAPGPPSAPPGEPPSLPPDPNLPKTELDVKPDDDDLLRGKATRVRGQVMSDDRACAHIRVDVVLEGESRPRGVVVGSLSTDADGRYDGSIVVPRDVSPGEYRLLVVTSGDAQCAPGRSE